MSHLDEIRNDFRAATTKIGTRKNLPLHTTLHYHVEEFIHDTIKAYKQLPNLDDFDRMDGSSYKPWRVVQEFLNFRAREGTLDREERIRFSELYDMLRKAAVNRADILLTTTNYSGSQLVKQFPATFCLQDEAASTSIAASLIPLVEHEHLDGHVLFGDERQLNQFVLMKDLNEFGHLYELSLFKLLLQKGADLYALDTQYRMYKPVADFISSEFYEGKLETANIKLKPDEIARKVMAVSTQAPYRVHGEGSAFFGIDVVNGRSRLEDQGSSLINFTNVDVVGKLYQRLVDQGIGEKKIAYLSYYRGQLKAARLHWMETGQLVPLSMNTVDIFQGSQAPVIILDLVHGCPTPKSMKNYSSPTAHVKSSNRLNVGISRAESACIVIFSAHHMHRGAEKSSVASLVVHLEERGWLVEDKDSVDPTMEKEIQRSEKKLAETQRRQRFGKLLAAARKYRKQKQKEKEHPARIAEEGWDAKSGKLF